MTEPRICETCGLPMEEGQDGGGRGAVGHVHAAAHVPAAHVPAAHVPAAPGSDLEVAEAHPPDAPPAVEADHPLRPPVRRRVRWAVVALIVAIAVAVAGGIGLAATRSDARPTSSGPSPVLGRVPAQSFLFAEVRLDQPGDQAANLKALLTRFPALSSGPTSSTALADDLNMLLRFADGVDAPPVEGDLGAWVDRVVALALLPGSSPGQRPGALVLIDVKDPGAAMDWLRRRVTAAGLPPLPAVTYHGVEVMLEQAVEDGSAGGDALAAVLDGRTLVVGREDAVHAAIDTTPSKGLGTSPGFGNAQAALGADALAALYVDLRAVDRAVPSGNSETGEPGLTAFNQLLARLPDWVSLRLRAEPGMIRLDKANPPTTGGTQRANVADAIASKLPATTLAVMDYHDFGLDEQAYLNILRSTTSTGMIRDLETSLAAIGGLDALLGAAGTVDVVTIASGERLLGGLVVQVPDAGGATRLVEAVAAWAATQGYTVTREDHGGVTITNIDLHATWNVLDERPFVQLAVQGNLLVVGYNRGFTPAILDVEPATALAAQPRYQRALAAAGTPNTQSCFADLAGLLAVAEREAAAAGNAADYQAEVRPWLAPLDTLSCASVSGNPDRASVVIVLREPAP